MAKCPNCGSYVETPERSLKNWFFHVESYICKKCGYKFKAGNGIVITEKGH